MPALETPASAAAAKALAEEEVQFFLLID